MSIALNCMISSGCSCYYVHCLCLLRLYGCISMGRLKETGFPSSSLLNFTENLSVFLSTHLLAEIAVTMIISCRLLMFTGRQICKDEISLLRFLTDKKGIKHSKAFPLRRKNQCNNIAIPAPVQCKQTCFEKMKEQSHTAAGRNSCDFEAEDENVRLSNLI